MKTIGILGGMSWESTAVYYRRLNELARARYGGNASADILLHSYNFDQIEALQHEGKWDELAARLSESARSLEAAGADLMIIATNTMHVLAPQVEAAIGVPLVHIADSVGHALRSAGLRTVALLGTRFTMEGDFYTGRLAGEFDITTLIPDEKGREVIHNIIYNELCQGVLSDGSRQRAAGVIAETQGRGAQAVILGCTELPLLISNESSPVPVFDTMELHIQTVADLAFG